MTPLRRWLRALALLVALTLAGQLAYRPFDNLLMDALLRRHAHTQTPDPELLLVDIDDYSLGKMNPVAGRWPWPRAVYAETLDAMADIRIKALVFDILFSEADSYAGSDSDRYFAEVLARFDTLCLPILVQNPAPGDPGRRLQDYPAELGLIRMEQAVPEARAHLLLPYAIPESLWRLGSINFVADSDGVGRHYEVYRDLQGWRVLSLPARVTLVLGRTLPDQARIALNWRGDQAMPFRKLAFHDLYVLATRSAAGDGQAKLELRRLLEDRVVVIGASASGLYDFRPTPIAAQQPGVALLATAIDNLKNERYLRESPAWAPLLLSLVLVAGLLALFARLTSHYARTLIIAGLSLAALAGGTVLASYALLFERILFPVGTPLLTAALAYAVLAIGKGVREYVARRRAIAMFSRFLDPQVVNNLLAAGALNRGTLTKSCTLTVLFSDIRGFTTLSEEHSAEQILDILNRYFSLQVAVIFRHGGTLDKFIGDAIMAFWGAPGGDPQQAEHAVGAALEMCEVLQRFRAELGSVGERFDVGIGIHTGPAVVGIVGSSMHYDYTAIGDTVNLASRIEGLTKGLARVLVSKTTREACGSAYAFRDVGSHAVKGRQAEVHLYEPRVRGLAAPTPSSDKSQEE